MYEKNIKKILLVEDGEKNKIAALNYFSKRKDLQVEAAMDYNQAMKILEKEKFDAAIIDLFMPQQIGNNDISLGRKIVRKIAENVDWLGEGYIETMEKAMLDSSSNQPLGLEIA
jgi:CheY-like chemotaxis protein